jgi:hypothetical protein
MQLTSMLAAVVAIAIAIVSVVALRHVQPATPDGEPNARDHEAASGLGAAVATNEA